ncbi:MAG: glycosyltransferase [Thermoplasmata archaeon]|nr:MAG: glycosyltransferase [Thermoplasmata archaeon]
MIKDHLIVFFPLVDWDAPWQRYQHLAKVFSRHNRVIYCEPPHSIGYLVRRIATLRKKVTRFGLKKRVNENLFVLQPPPILPLGTASHIVNCINQFIISWIVRISTRGFDERRKLCLWISDAIHYPLIQRLKPKISVYDCTDAFFFRDSRRQAYHDQLRHRTMRDSSISFFTSRLYFEEGRRYSDNCHYVPNGVDIGNFRKRHYPVPEEMTDIRRPILGFVGSLDSRIDLELIKEILRTREDVSLVFVGPVIEDSCELDFHDRVFLLGKKSFREIPYFIKQFDVALIPYIPERAQAVYPVKLHEYLILGKPVVSTNINEITQFSEIVYVADNRYEFIEKIQLALDNHDRDREGKRIQTALKNTWTDRLKKINRQLRKLA